MLLLLGLIFLIMLCTGAIGRMTLGLLILLPVILIGFLLLKLFIFALPVLLVIGIVALIVRGVRRSEAGY